MSIYSKYFNSKGFTLTELIVVMTIATVIMTTIVFQNRKWDDQLSVNSQTYEVALLLRQAQISSLAVRENSKPDLQDNFNIGYGVYFNQPNQQIIFFADSNNNKVFNSPSEQLETKTLARGVTIDRICGNSVCSGASALTHADITFYRA